MVLTGAQELPYMVTLEASMPNHLAIYNRRCREDILMLFYMLVGISPTRLGGCGGGGRAESVH